MLKTISVNIWMRKRKMSSVKHRIIIEGYIDGGYGVIDVTNGKDAMGLTSKKEVIVAVNMFLDEESQK